MRRPAVAVLLSALLAIPGVGVLPTPVGAVVTAPDVGVFATTSLAPGLTLTDATISGPNRVTILTANLAEPTLQPTYLNPGTVSATATLTTMANRVGRSPPSTVTSSTSARPERPAGSASPTAR